MVDKNLTMPAVVKVIQEEYENFLHVLGSDDNAQKLILRIR